MTTDLVIRAQNYQDQLRLFGLTAFMSRRGNCYVMPRWNGLGHAEERTGTSPGL